MVDSLALLSKLTLSIAAKDVSSGPGDGSQEWKLASEVEGDGRCCAEFVFSAGAVAG